MLKYSDEDLCSFFPLHICLEIDFRLWVFCLILQKMLFYFWLASHSFKSKEAALSLCNKKMKLILVNRFTDLKNYSWNFNIKLAGYFEYWLWFFDAINTPSLNRPIIVLI